MRINYSISGKSIGNKADPIGFLLSNNKGGYCYLGSPKSRYQGLYLYFDDMYKIMSDIRNEEPIEEINSSLNMIKRKRKTFTETFLLYENSLVYETDKKTNLSILLDIKKSYDNREFGRYYDVIEEDDIVIVKFSKKTDNKEDSSQGKNEYDLYVAIYCDEKKHIKQWIKEDYSLDRNRNSAPYSRYVFKVLECYSDKILISADFEKEKAKKNIMSVKKNIDKIKNMEKKKSETCFNDKIEDKNIRFAYACAKHSLNSLVSDVESDFGIFAGLPWFFQFWTRDEAISCLDVKHNKEILLEQIKNILPDGRIPNIRLHHYNGEPNASADGVGWSFFRLSQTKLNKKEKEFVKKQLKQSIGLLLKYHSKDDFAVNYKLETWMDTGEKDTRQGIRIEIQALRLAMYKFAYKLTKDKKYLELEYNLRKKVKKCFFNNNYLYDGLKDSTVRPNVFIAAYIYPELLTKTEWIACISKILPKLWFNWGGLSTIDRSNKLFKKHHTGENTDSYHRGDSWFWINNLAAIVMNKIDKKKFKKQIDNIIQASAYEILWKGLLGHHAELSSADKLKSQGCLCQAWSNAMFIELIDDIISS